MSTYNIVLSTSESTVVTEYEPQTKRSDSYQSETALEQAFIKMLGEQGYEYVAIHNEEALISNLRRQLELLNDYSFTDKEWQSFFKDKIANSNDGIIQKTRKIQEDNIQNLIQKTALRRILLLLIRRTFTTTDFRSLISMRNLVASMTHGMM